MTDNQIVFLDNQIVFLNIYQTVEQKNHYEHKDKNLLKISPT